MPWRGQDCRGAILNARSTGEPERARRALALLVDLLHTRYGQLNTAAKHHTDA